MKIKLVAIAKDESLYLPEWIYHHLILLGFDSISIGLNGISDNSEELLKKISQKYCVDYEYIDYFKEGDNYHFDEIIDRDFLARNPLQSRFYAKKYIESTASGYDFVVFLDIDEFLYCQNYEILLSLLKNYEIVKLKWFNLSGEKSFNDLWVSSSLKGVPKHRLSKVIVKTGLDICIKSTHDIKSRTGCTYISGYGPKDDGYNWREDVTWDSNIFIVHRWLRSEKEYLSSLGRGDTIKNTESGLKLNRPGFSRHHDLEISLDDEYISCYRTGYSEFLSGLGIISLMTASESFVLERYNYVVDLVHKQKNNFKDLAKILKGTGLALDTSEKKPSRQLVDAIRDAAKMIENRDPDTALLLYNLALEHRPEGRFIRARIAKLQEFDK